MIQFLIARRLLSNRFRKTAASGTAGNETNRNVFVAGERLRTLLQDRARHAESIMLHFQTAKNVSTYRVLFINRAICQQNVRNKNR